MRAKTREIGAYYGCRFARKKENQWVSEIWIDKSEFVEGSPCRETGERALPGGSSLFWKSEPKSTRGSHPWTPYIYSARKDTLFLLSFPSTPAIELLYRQSLRRNYQSALKLGFCGDMTCGCSTIRFYPLTLLTPGLFILSRTTAAGGGNGNTLEASWHSLSGSY